MADWPDLALLKQALGANTDAKDSLLELALGSAIEGVVADCGGDAVEVTFSNGTPTVALLDPSAEEPVEVRVSSKVSSAALLLSVTVMKATDAPFGIASTFDSGAMYVARRRNPNYLVLVKGNRLRFGIS